MNKQITEQPPKRQVAGWLPIETAPKKGTAVWLLCDGVPYIGYGEEANPLFEREERWTAKAGFRRHDKHDDEIFLTHFRVQPTHWQPLPEPPKGQS